MIRYGYQRLHTLLRREGWTDNHKRVHRLYCREGLNLRSKRPKRSRAAAHRLERLPTGRLHQRWRMDFVADNRFDGRKIRALTVVDNFSRQCLVIHVGQSLKGEDVVAVMGRLQQALGLVPERIQVDNGSEFIARRLTVGPTTSTSRWTSPGPANPRIIRTLNRLTAASATSA